MNVLIHLYCIRQWSYYGFGKESDWARYRKDLFCACGDIVSVSDAFLALGDYIIHVNCDMRPGIRAPWVIVARVSCNWMEVERCSI